MTGLEEGVHLRSSTSSAPAKIRGTHSYAMNTYRRRRHTTQPCPATSKRSSLTKFNTQRHFQTKCTHNSVSYDVRNTFHFLCLRLCFIPHGWSERRRQKKSMIVIVVHGCGTDLTRSRIIVLISLSLNSCGAAGELLKMICTQTLRKHEKIASSKKYQR